MRSTSRFSAALQNPQLTIDEREFLHHLMKPDAIVRHLLQTSRLAGETDGTAIQRSAFDRVRTSLPRVAIRLLQGPTCPIDLDAHQRCDVSSQDLIAVAAVQQG